MDEQILDRYEAESLSTKLTADILKAEEQGEREWRRMVRGEWVHCMASHKEADCHHHRIGFWVVDAEQGCWEANSTWAADGKGAPIRGKLCARTRTNETGGGEEDVGGGGGRTQRSVLDRPGGNGIVGWKEWGKQWVEVRCQH